MVSSAREFHFKKCREMKYAILSDLHANYTALSAVLDDCKQCGVESIVCLGDIVGYGPQPSETLALIRSVTTAIIAGNHDDAVSGRMSADDFIDLAADAVARHRAALSKDELTFLRDLPYTTQLEHALAAHGDFIQPDAFNYVLAEADAAANFSRTAFPILFVGHTHIPRVFCCDAQGEVTMLEPGDITLEDNHRYLINPGSVGYPRETLGQCFSSYVIYDSTALTIQYRFIPFTIASVMQRGKSAADKKPYWWMVLAALFLLGLGAAVFVANNRTRQETFAANLAAPSVSTNPLVITNKTITLASSATCVRPNLRLKKGSAAVALETVFLDAEGRELKRLRDEVKSSRKKDVPIPPTAITVRFEVHKYKRIDAPIITRFEPEAFFKPGTTRK